MRCFFFLLFITLVSLNSCQTSKNNNFLNTKYDNQLRIQESNKNLNVKQIEKEWYQKPESQMISEKNINKTNDQINIVETFPPKNSIIENNNQNIAIKEQKVKKQEPKEPETPLWPKNEEIKKEENKEITPDKEFIEDLKDKKHNSLSNKEEGEAQINNNELEKDKFYIQVGVFKNINNVKEVSKYMKEKVGENFVIIKTENELNKILSGPYETMELATKDRNKLGEKFQNAKIFKH